MRNILVSCLSSLIENDFPTHYLYSVLIYYIHINKSTLGSYISMKYPLGVYCRMDKFTHYWREICLNVCLHYCVRNNTSIDYVELVNTK